MSPAQTCCPRFWMGLIGSTFVCFLIGSDSKAKAQETGSLAPLSFHQQRDVSPEAFSASDPSFARTANSPELEASLVQDRPRVYKASISPNWFDNDERFWYRNALPNNRVEVILVDAKEGTRELAFDHQRLAAALSEQGIRASADRLPLKQIQFIDDATTILFTAEGKPWKCSLEDYKLVADSGETADIKADTASLPNLGRVRPSQSSRQDGAIVFDNQTDETVELFWVGMDGNQTSYGSLTPGSTRSQHTFIGHVWHVKSLAGESLAVFKAEASDRIARLPAPKLTRADQIGRRNRQRLGQRATTRWSRSGSATSPDGKWIASTRDYNLFLRQQESEDDLQLTTDGNEQEAYQYLQWAPDSSALVVLQVTPGDRFDVHLVESSPSQGGRAVLHSRNYPLPGDRFNSYRIKVIDPKSGTVHEPISEPIDFGFPRLTWLKDQQTFVFEKIDRGHQRYRLMQFQTDTKTATALIDEETETFIWTAHRHGFNVGIINWLKNRDALIYSSEKEGYRHLYWLDLESDSPSLKPITQGQFVVRDLDFIDEENQQIWFQASGLDVEQDPYFLHHCRVNFDGSEMTRLTSGNGTHQIKYSPSRKYIVDSYSRVDQAPIHELRNAQTGQLICELEKADISELQASGWRAPEVVVSKGRDGKTDIWGFICHPKNFDPSQKYPVIEDIYAGPHGSHVPKSFSASNRYASLTSLGFFVAKVDGMGTANRSKAFHDVCWQNLKDSGFPDRICWHQTIAEKYSSYDISRMGIYGTSAGGQNSTGAMLFHPEFYKVAVSACGCHDNRMDKASWNEQWMGYPVGPHYAASSNIDNAKNLVGKLLLIVGEMDTNVPPESTYRLVDALIKANKDFDFLMVPGGGHGMGGSYGRRKMHEFFVEHLQPPTSGKLQSRTGRRIQKQATQFVSLPEKQPVRVEPQTRQKIQSPPASQPLTEENLQQQEPLDVDDLFRFPSEAKVARLRYEMDRGSLLRFYSIPVSPTRHARMRAFYRSWELAIKDLNLSDYSKEAQADFANLQEALREEMQELNRLEREVRDVEQILPFAAKIIALAEARQRVDELDAELAAREVSDLAIQIQELTKKLEEADDEVRARFPTAVQHLKAISTALEDWHEFYYQYDPSYTWWLERPYEETQAAIENYRSELDRLAVESNKENSEDGDSRENAFPATPQRGPSQNVGTQATTRDNSAQLAIAWTPAIDGETNAPDLNLLLERAPSRLQPIIEEFRQEMFPRRARRRRPNSSDSSNGTETDRLKKRLERFQLWESAIKDLPYDEFRSPEQIDYHLLRNRIQAEQRRLEYQIRTFGEEPAIVTDESGIKGVPIGQEALSIELAAEMIPYTPEELVEIAEQEYEWCQRELKRAAQEMGFGDDWRAAVEKVKTMHVEPGGQPVMIRDLAREAIDYLLANDLVSVPPIAAETWRMQMMTPERQLVNPFFTGGEVISVSFPTSTMKHEDKLQSLRGNNIPFARATVQHELIPGHHLQMFLNGRNCAYRRPFNTPFWLEGWALYWEFLLYDKGFPPTPEDRIGFLVWRSHRCARIVFSLNFHLGRMTPQECVDLLVARVGFERKNAEAEVRRSVGPAYSPLYQAAYMLGGIQFRSLHREFVDSGKMTDQEFHDAILQENSIPVTLVRAIISKENLTQDAKFNWRFYDQEKIPK